MKEFVQREIALFNYLSKVDIIPQASLAQMRSKGSMKDSAPFFGSTDLLVEGFFSRLQDGYNVNTVPTVIRLTNKL